MARRFTGDDLAPSGTRDATYGRELLRGPDGEYHFIGDRTGTFRDDFGRLHDRATGDFTKDDNPPSTPELQARAQPDLSTARKYMPDRPDPSDVAVRAAVHARQQIAADRGRIWDETLAPIADVLRGHGIRLHPSNCSSERVLGTVRDSSQHLTRMQRLELRAAGLEYAELSDKIRAASERLGTAGGALVVAREFSDGRTLTQGDTARGTPHNLDRVLFLVDGKGTFVAIEEKGASSALGSRWVDNPVDPAGPRIRAEQCSPEYLRHMLQYDTKLRETLRTQPELRATLQAVINGEDQGALRYLLVHTSTAGDVSATDYLIGNERLGRTTIRLAGSTDDPEDR